MPQNQPDMTKTINQIKELVTKNDAGIIVLPAKATPDAIASATALYIALIKMGKQVSIVASSIPQSDLMGADKIKTDLSTGGNNLIISFPYEDGTIDRIDHTIENDRFNLIIVPREGQKKLDPKDVQYSYAGGKIDFIITIDAPNLNTLGEIYQKNQRTFDGKNIINIDRHLINNSYGTINLVVKTSSSTSELILKVITGLNIEIDKDIATNLYSGVTAATNNFTAYSVNANTFETVAQLLRAGAVKKPTAPNNPFMRPSYDPQPFGDLYGQGPGMSPVPFMQEPFGQPSRPAPQGMPVANPRPRPTEKQQKAVGEVEMAPADAEGNSIHKEAPENFLKPKIFSESGGLV